MNLVSVSYICSFFFFLITVHFVCAYEHMLITDSDSEEDVPLLVANNGMSVMCMLLYVWLLLL